MTTIQQRYMKRLKAGALSLVLAAAASGLAAWTSSCSSGGVNQAGSEVSSRARPKGSLKGFQAINDQLSQSISALGGNNPGGSLVGSVLSAHLPAGVTVTNANELLGGWVGGDNLGGTPSRFVSGTPGPVNMFLWTLVLRSLASELALLCEDSADSALVATKYLPEFRNDLRNWCANKTPQSFDALWIWIQGFESEAERGEVFRSIAPHVGALSASDILFVMMMNPHFLLEK